LLFLPAVEEDSPVEVGTPLPVLRRTDVGTRDPETLAAQALVLACALTADEVHARPELLAWAEEAKHAEFSQSSADGFDMPLEVSVTTYGSHPTLRMTWNSDDAPALTSEESEARAFAFVDRLFDQGSVVGPNRDAVERVHISIGVVAREPTDLPESQLVELYWHPFIGRGRLPLAGLQLLVRSNGHIGSVSLPLLRFENTGETVTAQVPESEAQGLVLEKTTASLSPGFTLHDRGGQLSYPIPLSNETTVLHWQGRYHATHPDRPSRPESRFLSLVDPSAPLLPPE